MKHLMKEGLHRSNLSLWGGSVIASAVIFMGREGDWKVQVLVLPLPSSVCIRLQPGRLCGALGHFFS